MDLLSTLQISLCQAHSIHLTTKWHNVAYQDNINRLYLVESGSQWVRIANRKYIIKPGVFLFIPAGIIFDFGCDKQCMQHYIHFRTTLLSGIPAFNLLSYTYERNDLSEQNHRLALHTEMETLSLRPETANQMRLNGILMQLLADFIVDDNEPKNSIPQAKRFHPILTYIEAHLDQPVSVPELAERMHLNRAHFTRAFTQAFGISPARYILSRRISLSQQLLIEHPNDTLERIASLTGFLNAFHFSRSFTRITGKPPSVYRNQIRP